MQLSRATFLTTAVLQIFFLVIDITCNALSDQFIIRERVFTLQIIYVLQDTFILISITLVCFSLFRTNIFKSGFMSILLERFKLPLIFSIIYLLLTLGLQADILVSRNNKVFFWGHGIDILYFSQRFVAVFYYYFIKRTALRLSDPRFYDPEWVKHAIAHESRK